MSAISQRLKSYEINFPAEYSKFDVVKTLTKDIDARPLIKDLKLLEIQYSVHCAWLARDVLRGDKPEPFVTEQIITALMMADMLEYIYRQYTNEPHEIPNINSHQMVYRSLLKERKYPLSNNNQAGNVDAYFSKVIHARTPAFNFPRLLIGRTRRFLNTTTLLLADFEQYCRWVRVMDQYLGPVLFHLSWFFFMPRLFNNLFLIIKHLYPGESWMSKEERDLGWWTRFRAQMDRCAYELGNDIVWIATGLTTCFVFIGVLAPTGFYVGFAAQVYDVVLASIRAYIEISRLKALEALYMAMPDKSETEGYLTHFRERIHFEEKRLYLQVINTSLIVLAVALAMPLFAFNPIIPMIGALLAVADTIAIRLLEPKRPDDKVHAPKQEIPKPAFFQPAPVLEKSSEDLGTTCCSTIKCWT